MPTLRSEFSIEQFERVLQKFAHEQPKFNKVAMDDVTIEFRYDDAGKIRRINVSFHNQRERNYWSFTIEPKAYLDSPHITKVSWNYGEIEERFRKWVKELMGGY